MRIKANVLIRTESAFLAPGHVGDCIDSMAKTLIAAGMAEADELDVVSVKSEPKQSQEAEVKQDYSKRKNNKRR